MKFFERLFHKHMWRFISGTATYWNKSIGYKGSVTLECVDCKRRKYIKAEEFASADDVKVWVDSFLLEGQSVQVNELNK